MPRQAEFTYKVISRNGYAFPLDMLRYDTSIPASESDAYQIAGTFDISVETKGTVVELRYMGNGNAPTVRRWRSFGWEVARENGGTAIITEVTGTRAVNDAKV